MKSCVHVRIAGMSFSHTTCPNTLYSLLHLQPSLNCRRQWGTTDDFTTSFLRGFVFVVVVVVVVLVVVFVLFLFLFSTAFWDLANSRPVHSLICLPTSLSVCLVFFSLYSWLYPKFASQPCRQRSKGRREIWGRLLFEESRVISVVFTDACADSTQDYARHYSLSADANVG